MSENASDRILELWAALPQEFARTIELFGVSNQKLAEIHKSINPDRTRSGNTRAALYLVPEPIGIVADPSINHLPAVDINHL